MSAVALFGGIDAHSQSLSANIIDLTGSWRFQLDPMGFGKTPGSELYLHRLTDNIHLPGSTDEGQKGINNIVSHVDRLSRRWEYCGQAWYQREVAIPEDWADKEIVLNLERCHWETTVYVDGEEVGKDERLSTPNRFVLTPWLTPGTHTLTICVDNRVKYDMDQWAHGITEYTQTNWNGIVGDIQLTALPATYIQDVTTWPDIHSKSVKARVELNTKDSTITTSGNLIFTLREREGKEVATTTALIPVGQEAVEMVIPIGNDMRLWDEFNPSLYDLQVDLQSPQGDDRRLVTFGMREVEQGSHHLRLNGRDIHLRGTLECCVFPLTGYPATTKDEWLRIMHTVKEYGMNHVRFHSWCPPEAAFDAADETGVYIQAELPMWIKNVGSEAARRDFFEAEMRAILREYGNHPSFLLYCNGNENEGDFSVLEDLIQKGQTLDNRHLYSASTARDHVMSDQYYVSHVAQRNPDADWKWVTVYNGRPSTDWDLNEACAIDVPVIAHETGQRCMYPNFSEMEKYTGVLEPRNMEVYRERLEANGMLSQAEDFLKATGAHTILQYKEVNEALLRTSTSAGFQLLGLTDFPGQGCAFVGVLDAFWDSKGLVEPEVWRQSCAPTVLLARLPKRIYTPQESLEACLEIYHYGESPIKKGSLRWQLVAEDGSVVKRGRLHHDAVPVATVDTLGNISASLSAITEPGRYHLQATLGDVKNEWDIWVYPTPSANTPDFLLTSSWEEASAALADGRKVVYTPDASLGRKTTFNSHFWNPIMFRWSPMIVGTLIDATHAAFGLFPTDTYADWQWHDILNNAIAFDLTPLRDLTPIIQSVDTYEFNQKLGIAFEAQVGAGRLFVLGLDLSKDIDSRPASRQLWSSISQYVGSDAFQPAAKLSSSELDAIFNPSISSQENPSLSRAAQQLLNK